MIRIGRGRGGFHTALALSAGLFLAALSLAFPAERPAWRAVDFRRYDYGPPESWMPRAADPVDASRRSAPARAPATAEIPFDLFRRERVRAASPHRPAPLEPILGDAGPPERQAPEREAETGAMGRASDPAGQAAHDGARTPLLPPLPHGGTPLPGGRVERVRSVESARSGFPTLVPSGR